MIINYSKRYGILKKLRYSYFLFIVLFVFTSEICGQQTRRENPPIKERLFFGGSFGLQFGTITDIEFSPVIGIWVLPRIAIAAGPDFRYFKDPWGHTTIYGGKSYVELIFLQDLDNIIPLGLHLGMFLHLEDEALSLESSFFKTTPYDSRRFMINTILGGGGIRQQIGQRSSLNLTFLWALNDSGYGIYGKPEIRVSFIF
jgi:hypothetical protein